MFYYESELIPNQFFAEEIDELVKEAEVKSGEICEYCGGEGRPAQFGRWHKTCCPDCLVEYKEEHPKVYCKFVTELIKPITL